MYIDDFIWLPDIVDKLAVKHYVTQSASLALILSARDMDQKERRRYGRK
jgi:hypothetical protein